MTFSDAIQRRIWKIRLPWFELTAYVDPRVTEEKQGLVLSPIIDPQNVLYDSEGEPYFPRVVIDAHCESWAKHE